MKRTPSLKKTVLPALIAVAMLLLLIPFFVLPASAETEGYYTYTVSGGKASITNVDISISGAVTIPTTLGGYPVTGIEDKAFFGCFFLTSIEIPSSVTQLGNQAFQYCASLSSVSFGADSQLTSIGASAFSWCFKLADIEIPASVKSIGARAFFHCSSLESITIPFVGATLNGKNNTHFGYIFGASSYADNNDYIPASLKTVVVTGGKRIRAHAFSGCSSLTSVEIPSSVTNIGAQAFYGCSSLESIVVPFVGATPSDMIDTHFGYIFGASSCSDNSDYVPMSLKNVVITGGNMIGASAFSGCSSLESIHIPSSVTNIGAQVFSGCSSLIRMTVDPVNPVYHSAGNCLIETASKTLIAGCQSSIIPADGSVTGIGAYAFHNCFSLASIKIPSSVTSIGTSAFHNCFSLASIEIPSSLTNIGREAFYNCSSLTGIEIPSLVTNIDNCTFWYCSSLTSITFADNSHLASIGDEAFRYCSSLTSIDIPSSTVQLGDYAFYGCYSLTNVSFGEGQQLQNIGDWAFYYCASLTNISIPTSVTSIGHGAFYDCNTLANIHIPSSVTSIGDQVFSGCSSVISITVDSDNPVYRSAGNCLIETASKTLITGCKNSIIPTDGSVMSIGISAFYKCSPLASILIPSSVTSIGDYAFYGCSSLKSISIPSSVTSINNGIFWDCASLTSILIPSSVTSISHYAFYNCSKLTDIYYIGIESQWKKVTIGSNNTCLQNAKKHFDPCYYGHDEISHEAKVPTCTEIGWDTYVSCSRCDYTTYEEKEALAHTFDHLIAEKRYLKTPATTTNSAVYYKSCACGAKGTDTFAYGESLPKTPPASDDSSPAGGCGGSITAPWSIFLDLGITSAAYALKKKKRTRDASPK